jgi:two-component system phosphate regulon sensor histidine kinase PhoR
MSSEPHPGEIDSHFAEHVSVACHDLRTPLATVYGFARTLERLGGLDDRQMRYLGMVVAGAQELTRLIDDLATLTRLERGIQTIERGRVDLTELVDTVATEAADRHAPGRTIYAPNHGHGHAETDHRLAVAAVSGLVDGALRLDPHADRIELTADGSSVLLGPLSANALQLYAQADRDLRLAAARATLDALDATVVVEREHLRVVFPQVAT